MTDSSVSAIFELSYSLAAEENDVASDLEGCELPVDSENIGKLSEDSCRWKGGGLGGSICDSSDKTFLGKSL
jgi:hypothetical protein